MVCLSSGYGPHDAQASAEGRHGQVGHVVAGQLQRRLATDSGLGILREGCEAVDLLEDGQVALRIGDGLEAAEVLVVLVKAADDEFDGVVGGRDGAGAEAIGQLGPVTLKEVEDHRRLGQGLDIVWAQSEHGRVTFSRQGQRVGVEDGIDLAV